MTLELGEHTAHIDPRTGSGFLVLRLPTDIVFDLQPLDEVLWDRAVSGLAELGWKPSEGECEGDVVVEGRTSDGREVIGLYGLAPIIPMPSIAECIEAFAVLGRMAGLPTG